EGFDQRRKDQYIGVTIGFQCLLSPQRADELHPGRHVRGLGKGKVVFESDCPIHPIGGRRRSQKELAPSASVKQGQRFQERSQVLVLGVQRGEEKDHGWLLAGTRALSFLRRPVQAPIRSRNTVGVRQRLRGWKLDVVPERFH